MWSCVADPRHVQQALFTALTLHGCAQRSRVRGLSAGTFDHQLVIHMLQANFYSLKKTLKKDFENVYSPTMVDFSIGTVPVFCMLQKHCISDK